MDPDREFDQLKLLFDYTKMHIGLYTTIATIFGGFISASDHNLFFNFHPKLLFASVICICIAGVAGGTIASSIPGYSSYTKFWESPIGPFRFKGMKAEYWTYIEHTAFWVAVVLALLSVACAPRLTCGTPSTAASGASQTCAQAWSAVCEAFR